MTGIVLQVYQIVMFTIENVSIVIMMTTALFTETKSVVVVEDALKEVYLNIGEKGHVEQNVIFVRRFQRSWSFRGSRRFRRPRTSGRSARLIGRI